MKLKTEVKVLIFTFLSFTILTINFTNYSTLAGGVMQDLKLSYTQSGLILAIASVSYAAMQIPSGAASDRFGGIRVLIVSLSVMIAAGLGFAVAGSYESILASRVILGIGAGSTITSCVKLLSANFPADRMDRAIGVFASGWGAGFIVTFVVIPPVMASFTWRGGLYLTAGLTLLVLALLPLFLRGAVTGATEGKVKKLTTSKIRGKSSRRNLIACTMTNFTALSITVGTMTWAALYLQDKYQVSLVVAGLSAAVIGVASSLGALMGGFVPSKIGRRVVILVAMIGCFVFPILFFPSRFLFLDMIIVAAIGWCGVFYFGSAAGIVTTSVDERRVGLVFGLFNSVGFSGTFFSPLLIGYVLDTTGSYDIGFVILGLTALVGVVGALMIKKVGQ